MHRAGRYLINADALSRIPQTEEIKSVTRSKTMKSKKITTQPSNIDLPITAPFPTPFKITPITAKPPDPKSDPLNNQTLLTYVKTGFFNEKV